MNSLLREDSRRRPLATFLVLACLLLGLQSAAFSQHGKIITIDPPGTLGSVATSINEEGAVAGYYFDESGFPQPFVWNEGGTFTTFEVPGGAFVFAINEAGAITGYGADAFILSRRGINTTFDFPGAHYTVPLSINEDGAVAGEYLDENYSEFGFIRKPNGAMIKIAPPGSYLSTVNSINDDGAATGYNFDTAGAHGFVRSKSGFITEFDIQGADFVDPQSMNTHGAIAGYIFGDTGIHAFVRDEQGNVTTFDCPGSNLTLAYSINDRGAIGGYCAPGGPNWVGFVRDKSGTTTTFDLPGAVYPLDIPDGRLNIDGEGAVAGTYVDANNVEHGFLRRP